MAARKKKNAAKKKAGWGGARLGAGRPTGTGTGTGKHARINRVVSMLTNAEFEKLAKIAARKKLPLGTFAYQLLSKGLSRVR